jgi:hypothetical protein
VCSLIQAVQTGCFSPEETPADGVGPILDPLQLCVSDRKIVGGEPTMITNQRAEDWQPARAELLLQDIRALLAYRPGTVVLITAALLTHEVQEWGDAMVNGFKGRV